MTPMTVAILVSILYMTRSEAARKSIPATTGTRRSAGNNNMGLRTLGGVNPMIPNLQKNSQISETPVGYSRFFPPKPKLYVEPVDAQVPRTMNDFPSQRSAVKKKGVPSTKRQGTLRKMGNTRATPSGRGRKLAQ